MYTTIVDVATLYENLTNPNWAVVDCRFRLDNKENGRERYLESHVPGAVYAHLDEDLAGAIGEDTGRHPLPDLDIFRATLGGWGIGDDTQVVVYDDVGGSFAARLWWMLRYLGHNAVAVLDGGWQAWLGPDYLTSSGIDYRVATQFSGEPNPAMIATMAEVAALVAAGQGDHLIDSRDPKRYRGEHEPIDPQAGHIPGAKNRFLNDNLDSQQKFQSPETLTRAFQERLGDHASEEMIVYCGSGVTACHNLLAMEIAGLEGARLFIPSWSGWSSKPERAIETEEQ